MSSPEEFRARAARALLLAKRYPEAAEPLGFYAEIAAFQASVDPGWSSLAKLVAAKAPEPLRSAPVDEAACARAMENVVRGEVLDAPQGFFARVLLQASSASGACPGHRKLPQVGVLAPEGHGTALTLACALCFGEWAHPRGACFACGASDVVYYEAPEIPAIRVQLCEGCRRYIHIVRRDVDASAIPDVDELAALSLDVWARERGYRKIVPNLAGI